MAIIQNFIRDRAIKSYLKKLPRLLAKDYGRSKIYTPMQVKKTIERSKLNTRYVCYGISIFSGREAFDLYHQEIGESCSYDGMRSVIAEKYFDGNSEFGISDVISASSDYSGSFDVGGFDSSSDSD